MIVLDVTIVAIALPVVQSDLGLSSALLGWVVTVYPLVFGCCLLAAGRLADRVGRRRTFVIGLLVFGGASLACALAPTGPVLLAGRAAQGLGAALVSPAALALVTAARPSGDERRRALGWWTAAAAGGGASGWVLGGVVSGWLDWRWVFLVNVPVCLVCAALAPRLLAESRARLRRLRWRVLGRRAVLGPNGVAAVLTATTTPAVLLCTLHAQQRLGLSPVMAGLLFPPFNVAVIAASLLGPRITRGAIPGGLLAIAAGAGLLALHLAIPTMLVAFVLMGAGLGVASVASTAQGTEAVDADDQGVASALLATSAQLGTALGLAVFLPTGFVPVAALAFIIAVSWQGLDMEVRSERRPRCATG
ncbi:MFS transporter [Solirubrobacter phytolaccae]|uniref:MFS transporter n=1 Tax=Solirubrobacter phytolaccae TaxID=1404360 RepID=A0A9X3S5S6_9ACTN|nr:MFS transporter [Solirubrobacter phytolaccae]